MAYNITVEVLGENNEIHSYAYHDIDDYHVSEQGTLMIEQSTTSPKHQVNRIYYPRAHRFFIHTTC